MDLSDSAEHTFCLLENYGAEGSHAPDQPRHVYFARWVTNECLSLVVVSFQCLCCTMGN